MATSASQEDEWVFNLSVTATAATSSSDSTAKAETATAAAAKRVRPLCAEFHMEEANARMPHALGAPCKTCEFLARDGFQPWTGKCPRTRHYLRENALRWTRVHRDLRERHCKELRIAQERVHAADESARLATEKLRVARLLNRTRLSWRDDNGERVAHTCHVLHADTIHVRGHALRYWHMLSEEVPHWILAADLAELLGIDKKAASGKTLHFPPSARVNLHTSVQSACNITVTKPFVVLSRAGYGSLIRTVLEERAASVSAVAIAGNHHHHHPQLARLDAARAQADLLSALISDALALAACHPPPPSAPAMPSSPRMEEQENSSSTGWPGAITNTT